MSLFSTDFKGTGEMARLNLRWFPPLWRQALNFIKTGFLVDNKDFMNTCKFYYEDITFEEAYQLTRKHVCISVSRQASGGAGSGGPTKLLLNHISTPHVLIRSAVATSCALPGIMRANELLCKNADGEVVPFHVDGEGVQFIDGSVQADVPFRRMSALFSVSNFIVSQVNVHVIPFIGHKIPGALPKGSVVLKDMLSALDLDLRHRSVILSKMGIMPKFYGHDISSVFKQVYHGNVTIVPQMKMEEALGVKAIMHPSVQDMREYIRGGRKASWPHLRRVKHLLCLEASLWNILEDLVVNSRKMKVLSLPQGHEGDVVVLAGAGATATTSATATATATGTAALLIPVMHRQQSVSNLVMYSPQPALPGDSSSHRKKRFKQRRSCGGESMRPQRTSPRLQAMRVQDGTDTTPLSDDSDCSNSIDNFSDEEDELDEHSKDVYDEEAIAYMLQRIQTLETENLMLKKSQRTSQVPAEEEEGLESMMMTMEETTQFQEMDVCGDDVPSESRKRRLSSCLEPL